MFRSARPDGHREHRRSRRTVLAAGATAAVLLLSGCAAGQISQTAQQEPAIDGGNATAGNIGVRNVLVATPEAGNYPAGSDAELTLVVSNDGHSGDTLTGISSPAAGSVELSGDVPLPPQSLVYIGDSVPAQEPAATATLTDLASAFCFGQSIPITFTFAEAGQLTLRVPIENPTERTGARPTIEILPPHPTPVWESGALEAGHVEEPAADSAAGSGAADSGAEGADSTASAAPFTECNASVG